MDEKITIIEGPPPTFEVVDDGWTSALNEGAILSNIAVTRLRTFNGPALVERCNRAWRKQEPIRLEFRTADGLEQNAPIIAARYVNTEEGDMLLLWVRLPADETELELEYDDDLDDDDDDFDDDDFDDDDFDDDDDDEGDGINGLDISDWPL